MRAMHGRGSESGNRHSSGSTAPQFDGGAAEMLGSVPAWNPDSADHRRAGQEILQVARAVGRLGVLASNLGR